jgi:hypothetical protein
VPEGNDFGSVSEWPTIRPESQRPLLSAFFRTGDKLQNSQPPVVIVAITQLESWTDNKAKVELIFENDWRFRPPLQMAWNPNPSLHETHLGQTDSCMSRVSQFCPIDTFAFRCFMGPPQWGQCLGPAALNKFLCMSAPLATISKPK